MNYSIILVIITTVLLFSLSSISLADVSLNHHQNNNEEHLNPVNDQDQADLSVNNQDKRTICTLLNQCGKSNTGYILKRLVIRKPQLIPVVRPAAAKPTLLGGYRYTKPKIQFSHGWKPISASAKPVVEIHRPAINQHVDLVHHSVPSHLDQHHHHQLVVSSPDHLHLQPAQHHHIDQIHQINVPHHETHFDAVLPHVDHLHATPALIRPAPQPQFIPSPVLFEVTRPNLGVLPLGSRFLTPVLREYPHHHHHHNVHLHQSVPSVALPAIPVAHPHQPLPHQFPVVHQTPGISIINPSASIGIPLPQQPAFEYTRNYLPSTTNIDHHQQVLPFEHAHHGYFASQQQQQTLPHQHSTQFLAASEHALPHPGNPHFHHHQQQLQNLQNLQQYQEIPQGQLPLEGEQQHFAQHHQEAQHFEQNINNNNNNVIQPGQTDLQIPYHLPQHGVWNNAAEEAAFQPSQQLETPYHK